MDYKDEYPERNGCLFLVVGVGILAVLCAIGGILYLFT